MSIFPEAEGVGQEIFLLVIYAYFIFKGSKLLADGSDILRDIYGAGIVGGIVIPILGALPDGFIVLFSGLSSGTHEEIRDRITVGIGALAGASVMLITVPLCVGVFLGSRQLDEEGKAMSEYQPIAEGSNKLVLKPVAPTRFSLTDNGITALPSTPKAARWMVITCLTYLTIQIPALFYRHDDDGGTIHEKVWCVIGIALSTILFFAYIIAMWRDADSQEMVQERRQRVHKFMAWSTENKSLIGALDPVTLFNILDKDGDGLLDAEDLRLGFKTMGLKLNHQEAQAFFNMMDADGNIAVDINEFVNFVREFILTADNTKSAFSNNGGAGNMTHGADGEYYQGGEGGLASPPAGHYPADVNTGIHLHLGTAGAPGLSRSRSGTYTHSRRGSQHIAGSGVGGHGGHGNHAVPASFYGGAAGEGARRGLWHNAAFTSNDNSGNGQNAKIAAKAGGIANNNTLDSEHDYDYDDDNDVESGNKSANKASKANARALLANTDNIDSSVSKARLKDSPLGATHGLANNNSATLASVGSAFSNTNNNAKVSSSPRIPINSNNNNNNAAAAAAAANVRYGSATATTPLNAPAYNASTGSLIAIGSNNNNSAIVGSFSASGRKPGTFILSSQSGLTNAGGLTSASGLTPIDAAGSSLESMSSWVPGSSGANSNPALANANNVSSTGGVDVGTLGSGIPLSSLSLSRQAMAVEDLSIGGISTTPRANRSASIYNNSNNNTTPGGSAAAVSTTPGSGVSSLASPRFARVETFNRVTAEGQDELPIEIYAQPNRTDAAVIDRSQPPPPLPVPLMQAVLSWFNNSRVTAPALVRAGLAERYALHAWAARTGVLGHMSAEDPANGERVLKLVKLTALPDVAPAYPSNKPTAAPNTGAGAGGSVSRSGSGLGLSLGVSNSSSRGTGRLSMSGSGSGSSRGPRLNFGASSSSASPSAEWSDLSLPRWASASPKLFRYVRNNAADARFLGLTSTDVTGSATSAAAAGVANPAVVNINFPHLSKAASPLGALGSPTGGSGSNSNSAGVGAPVSTVVPGSGQPRTIHDLFIEADVHCNGALTIKDVIDFAERFELGISTVDIKVMFHTYDSDLDRTLSISDFRRFLEDLVALPTHPEAVAEAEAADLMHKTTEGLRDEAIVAAHGHMAEVTHGWSEQKKKVYGVTLLCVGMAIVAFFSDPMIEVITNLGGTLGVRPFYISFVVTPFASNAAEVIAALMFAQSKTNVSMALTLSSLYGAVTMNNTLCVAIFLAILLIRDLPWTYTAEVMTIITVELIVAFMVRKETIKQWQAVAIGLLFPLAIVMVYVLEAVLHLD